METTEIFIVRVLFFALGGIWQLEGVEIWTPPLPYIQNAVMKKSPIHPPSHTLTQTQPNLNPETPQPFTTHPPIHPPSHTLTQTQPNPNPKTPQPFTTHTLTQTQPYPNPETPQP